MLVPGSEAGAATKRRTRVPTGLPPTQLLPGDRAPWALGAWSRLHNRDWLVVGVQGAPVPRVSMAQVHLPGLRSWGRR